MLHERFGIEQGFITTVHAYTTDQQLQDQAVSSRSGKPDLRRMRAAALSIIPSTTGAARAIGSVMPDLKGKLDGTSLRVPTPTGSITDLVAVLKADASIDDINAAFAEGAADASYRGVLKYSDEPLVSADIVGDPSSCIFSSLDTMANGRLVKVLGWYDNEWGYSNRLVDLVEFVGTVPAECWSDARSGSAAGGSPAAQRHACAAARRFQRPVAGRRDHRRPAHHRRVAHDPLAARARGVDRGVFAPRSAQGSRSRASLAPVARRLGELLDTTVELSPQVAGFTSLTSRRTSIRATC